MREAPLNIKLMLSAYDRDLEMRWCSMTHAWYFWYQGTKQMSALSHPDGSTILDLYPSEVMEIVEQTDQNKYFGTFLQRLNRTQVVREHDYARKVEYDKRMLEMREETEAQIDCRLRGSAKPFSHIRNNPLKQERTNAVTIK